MIEPLAYVGQGLIAHCQDTMKIASCFADKQYLRIAADRLMVASNKTVAIEPGRIRTIVRMSSLLHDIGKADDDYQTQFALVRKPKAPSFFLHEVPSAVIGDRVSSILHLDWAESFLLSFSILNHHNAMRSINKIKSIVEDTQSLRRNGWRFRKWSESLNPLLEGISASEVYDILRDIKLNEVESYLNRMQVIIDDRNKMWTKLYSLILNPLIVGDNLDALKRDSEEVLSSSRLKFINELKEAVRIY
jgi:CRISPR-associated endonuclease Cas3-HD